MIKWDLECTYQQDDIEGFKITYCQVEKYQADKCKGINAATHHLANIDIMHYFTLKFILFAHSFVAKMEWEGEKGGKHPFSSLLSCVLCVYTRKHIHSILQKNECESHRSLLTLFILASLSILFHYLFVTDDESSVAVEGASMATYRLVKLKPYSIYMIYVSILAAAGSSPRSDPVYARTTEAGWFIVANTMLLFKTPKHIFLF